MARKVLLRLIALATLVCAAAVAGVAGAQPARAGLLGCDGQTAVQPFTPWLDPMNYALLTGGSLESTTGWTLSGGAKLVSGNEPWQVNAPTDSHSLWLPSGGSATSPAFCVTLLHPTVRFFAANSGSTLSTLQVDVITTVLGLKVTTPIGVLFGRAWQPTLPLPFLDGLLSGTQGTVQFRFTPLGAGSGWQIDDIYVDPFKSR